jgi:hypothetical protein
VTVLDAERFDAVFDEWTSSAFRLETLDRYTVEDEAEDLHRFLTGQPLPTLTPANDPWLARVAATTAAGQRWQRVHVVGAVTDYLRFELACYRDNVAAGEDVRIADRDDHPELADLRQDWWGFDLDIPEAFVVLMHYDADGRIAGRERTSEPVVLARCRHQRDIALAGSMPLGVYLDRRAAEEVGAAR